MFVISALSGVQRHVFDGELPLGNVDQRRRQGRRDGCLKAEPQQPWRLFPVFMAQLGFHVRHGFQDILRFSIQARVGIGRPRRTGAAIQELRPEGFYQRRDMLVRRWPRQVLQFRPGTPIKIFFLPVMQLTCLGEGRKCGSWHKEHFEVASPVNRPAHADGRLCREPIRRTPLMATSWADPDPRRSS